MPKVVTFSNANTITYTYDGAGNKLSVAYTAGSNTVKTDYVGNKVYKNGTLSMMHTDAESALQTVFPKLDASQQIKIPLALKIIYRDTKVTAPNNLYNAAMKLPSATNIKGPKSIVAKPYLQYYGK